MNVLLKSGAWALSNTRSLERYQMGQLSFWGFHKDTENDNGLFVSDSNSPSLLMDLINYFEAEGVELVISHEVEAMLAQERARKEELQRIRIAGTQFKEGDYDSINLANFRKFIESCIKRKLKDHQVKAAYHLYLIRNGANFSVPGSGKTTVVLTVYEKLRHEGKVNTLFVVGPPACFGPWKAEFHETLGRDPGTHILAGGNAESRKSTYHLPPTISDELYMTTFQSLTNDVAEVERWFSMRGVEPLMVVDEAHYIKQQKGTWASAVLRVSPHASRRCILTGTPMPNAFTDVFNLFDHLWGTNEVLSSEHKSQIVVAAEKGDYERCKNIVKSQVSPFFYRVRKADLHLAPQVLLPPHILSMNRIEDRLYKTVVAKIREFSSEDYLKDSELLHRLRKARVMRLRQCVSHPAMLKSAISGYDEQLVERDSDLYESILKYDEIETPAKVAFLIELAQGLLNQREKVVIWSQFISTIDLIASKMSVAGIRCKCVLGRTPPERDQTTDRELALHIQEVESREAIIREFLEIDSGMDVLVANPAACAESISLHKACQHAVYFDLSYNCAQYLQSMDRIHRVGGSEDRPAFYHFLEYEGTIDHDIRERLELKAQRMYQLIEDDYAVYDLDMFADDDGEDVLAYKRLFSREK